MNLPINEIFYSFQGEGSYSGTPMTFVRVAGCNLSCSFCDQPDSVPIAPMKLAYEKISLDEIYDLVSNYLTKEICFTGGEPTLFAKEIISFFSKLPASWHLHLETNGTMFTEELFHYCHHISVSLHDPKVTDSRVIMFADDIKVVMDENFEENLILANDHRSEDAIIWIQPVNEINSIHLSNLDKAMAFVLANPQFRLSPQWHKLLEVK